MPNPDSNARIEALLAAMTLGEKIGQMTLVSAGSAVTGPGGPVGHLLAVRSGAVGAIGNLWGAEQTQKLQRIAVEETSGTCSGITTLNPSRSRRARSPERRTPKRKSSPATTATAPIVRR